jgi:hypothetical protein
MQKKIFVLFLGIMVFAFGVSAQDMPQAKKYENPEWYYMVHVDFEPGKLDEALKMIKEKFAPATKEAGTSSPAMMLIHHGGEWDATFIWHLEGGIAEMEWEVSPDEAKWMAVFANREGGMENAMKIFGEYYDLVERVDAQLVRKIDFLPAEKKE